MMHGTMRGGSAAVFDVQCFGTVLTSQAFKFGQSHVIFDWCGLMRYFYWRSLSFP